MHVRAALRNGLSADEIKEVLLHCAIYCGVPAANGAFAVAQSVLERARRLDDAHAGRDRRRRPGGLTLAQLLHRAGIESVVLEDRSRDYVEARIRAGVLEQGTVDLLDERRRRRASAARRARPPRHRAAVRRRAAPHPAERARPGPTIVIYGQTEVVKDLIEARLGPAPLHFEVEDVSVHDLESERPRIRSGTKARTSSSTAT